MRILLWAECKKLHRSNIVFFSIFAAVLVAVVVLIGGVRAAWDGQFTTNTTGWYLETTQVWATMFALPAAIALLGSYMICREEQDDTMKALRLVPVSETKLITAKMLLVFVFSIFIYFLLFLIALSAETMLHVSGLSGKLILTFLKMYLLDGIGVFLAVSPMIALIPYLKGSYWLALILAETYSFAGLFMSMSDNLRTFYPITAIFGVSGYYETTVQNRMGSIAVLGICGVISVFLLKGNKRNA